MAARGDRIAIHIDPPFSRQVRRRPLTSLARRALEREAVGPPAEVSVVITSDEQVRELNARYRGIDAPTDVLSFGLDDDPAFASPPGSARQLGEVIISFPTAQRQASDAGHGIDDELAHLLVHGLLHLLGYDHERAGDARAMRAREEALLGHAAH
jgi:probable rRNA maturation factor